MLTKIPALCFFIIAFCPSGQGWANTGREITAGCSNVVALYNFNDGAKDASGNGHHGTPMNGVDCAVHGKFGSACRFDGVDDFIDFGKGISLDNLHRFTLSLWVKVERFDPTATLVYKRWRLYLAFDAVKAVLLEGGISSSMNHVVLKNQWTHLAATIDASESSKDKSIHLYVDGEEVKYSVAPTAISSPLENSSYNLTIGATPNKDHLYFKGSIDDFILFNRSLSAREILELAKGSRQMGCSACIPDCQGKTCGNDGCSGTCGECPSKKTCSPDRTQCIQPPACADHFDNDSDGLVDLDDPGCKNEYDETESVPGERKVVRVNRITHPALSFANPGQGFRHPFNQDDSRIMLFDSGVGDREGNRLFHPGFRSDLQLPKANTQSSNGRGLLWGCISDACVASTPMEKKLQDLGLDSADERGDPSLVDWIANTIEFPRELKVYPVWSIYEGENNIVYALCNGKNCKEHQYKLVTYHLDTHRIAPIISYLPPTACSSTAFNAAELMGFTKRKVIVLTGTTRNGSATINGIADTSKLEDGDPLTLRSGFPDGLYQTARHSSSSITVRCVSGPCEKLGSNAIASRSTTAVVMTEKGDYSIVVDLQYESNELGICFITTDRQPDGTFHNPSRFFDVESHNTCSTEMLWFPQLQDIHASVGATGRYWHHYRGSAENDFSGGDCRKKSEGFVAKHWWSNTSSSYPRYLGLTHLSSFASDDWYVAGNGNSDLPLMPRHPTLAREEVFQVILDTEYARTQKNESCDDCFTNVPLISRSSAGLWVELLSRVPIPDSKEYATCEYNDQCQLSQSDEKPRICYNKECWYIEMYNYHGMSSPSISRKGRWMTYNGTNGKYSREDRGACNKGTWDACEEVKRSWEGFGTFLVELDEAKEIPESTETTKAKNSCGGCNSVGFGFNTTCLSVLVMGWLARRRR